MRTIPSRRPLRRLRLLTESNADVAFAGSQRRIGRFVGRGYLSAERLRERTRIQRAQIPSRAESVATAVSVIGRQRSLLISLVVLIALGLALDVLVRTVGPNVTEALGVDDWIRETFALPSDNTLRSLLAASAAGTATILGLVLSISLIVWQGTVNGSRSTSIAAFLLRERVGSTIVRLLALGFTYSLWVLATLEILDGKTPYVSSLVALGISTAAALSLLGYREAGLLGYLPASIARSLRMEIDRAVRSSQRRNAGRSVEDYGRRVASAISKFSVTFWTASLPSEIWAMWRSSSARST